jgi:ABC-type multidrug transport system ATPase subunit
VGILDQGQLIAVGTMESLRAQAQYNSETTLEDLFLELTGGERVADIAGVFAQGERV